MTDYELLQLIREADKEYRRQIHGLTEKKEEGRSMGHGKILQELAKCDGVPQKELAERMRIRPQSLTEALLSLENIGFITRTRSERDRREQVVSLTESGREHSKWFHRISEEVTHRMFACLTEEEKECLASLLSKVISDSENMREKE